MNQPVALASRFLLIPLPHPLASFFVGSAPPETVEKAVIFPSLGTFLGLNALVNNTTGFGDTAVGGLALAENTSGNNNTAIGDVALFANTTGSNNWPSAMLRSIVVPGNRRITATGFGALFD